MTARQFGLVAILLLLGVLPVGAQATLESARALYASAAYDAALLELDRLQQAQPAPDVAREIQQQRAACLLALNRRADAEQAMAAVVQSDPRYRPDEAKTSPRIRAAFRDVRAKLLPGLVEREYTNARGAWGEKDYARAAQGFETVVQLLDDPDLAAPGQRPAPLEDLRLLAEGFLALCRSALAPAPPRPEPVPELVTVQRIHDSASLDVVPPVVVKQDLPRWPSAALAVPTVEGLLEVIIDETGAVESASMARPTVPLYDRLVLDAARSWRYQPATRDGRPVRYRKIIQIAFK